METAAPLLPIIVEIRTDTVWTDVASDVRKEQ
jgi:hypothetical protein